MLLHVEGSRVEGEAPPEKAVLFGGKSGGHEPSYGKNRDLHENGRDGEWLSPEGEESVEEDQEHT